MAPSPSIREHSNPSIGEWILGGVGALLALSLVALFGYQATVRTDGPELSVQIVSQEHTGEGFAVTVDVHNAGGSTAEGVHVAGEVKENGAPLASGQATIDYVPPDSRREITLVFPVDPREPGRSVVVHVDGYTTL